MLIFSLNWFAPALNAGQEDDDSPPQRLLIQLLLHRIIAHTLRYLVQLNLLLKVWISVGSVGDVGSLEMIHFNSEVIINMTNIIIRVEEVLSIGRIVTLINIVPGQVLISQDPLQLHLGVQFTQSVLLVSKVDSHINLLHADVIKPQLIIGVLLQLLCQQHLLIQIRSNRLRERLADTDSVLSFVLVDSENWWFFVSSRASLRPS